MNLPQVVSPAERQAAREALLVTENEATRARDALATWEDSPEGWPQTPPYETPPYEWWRLHDEFGARV